MEETKYPNVKTTLDPRVFGHQQSPETLVSRDGIFWQRAQDNHQNKTPTYSQVFEGECGVLKPSLFTGNIPAKPEGRIPFSTPRYNVPANFADSEFRIREVNINAANIQQPVQQQRLNMGSSVGPTMTYQSGLVEPGSYPFLQVCHPAVLQSGPAPEFHDTSEFLGYRPTHGISNLSQDDSNSSESSEHSHINLQQQDAAEKHRGSGMSTVSATISPMVVRQKQTSFRMFKRFVSNWLEKDGAFVILSLKPSHIEDKLRKQFPHLNFVNCSKSLENVNIMVKECSKNEVILINWGNSSSQECLGIAQHLRMFQNRKFVMYSNNLKHLSDPVFKIIGCEGLCELVLDELNWNELSQNLQAQLLEKSVRFQNRLVPLKSLMPSENYKQLLNALPPEFILRLEENEQPLLFRINLEPPIAFYMPRQLTKLAILKPDVESSETTEFEAKILKLFSAAKKTDVCLCGSVGSGKTTLLTLLGHILVSQISANSKHAVLKIVHYTTVENILKILKSQSITLKSKISTDTVYSVLSSLLANNKFADLYLRLPSVTCDLIVDELDKTSKCYLELVVKLLAEIQQNAEIKGKFRFWTAVNSNLLPYLRKYINVDCYSIVPLSSHQRMYFMGVCDSLSLRNLLVDNLTGNSRTDEQSKIQTKSFSEICSKNLSDFERNFIGTPLYCHLLAQSCQKQIHMLFSPSKSIPPSTLYETYIASKLKGENSAKLSSHLKFYQKLALQKLLPQHVNNFKTYFRERKSTLDNLQVDFAQSFNTIFNPVVIHQTVAEYLVASFVHKLATQNSKEKKVPESISSLIADIVVPNYVKRQLKYKNNSEFWHHNISNTEDQLILYFIESFLYSDSETEQKSFTNFLNTIFKNIYSKIPITPVVFQMLADFWIDKPIIAKLVVSTLGPDYEPLEILLATSVGCRVLYYALRDESTKTEIDLRYTVKSLNTTDKVIRYLINKDVLNYCRTEYEIEPVNGRLNKCQKDRIRSVENAFYWKLIYFVIQKRHPDFKIWSLDTITKHWFTETESDTTKLEVYNEDRNKLGLEYKFCESILEDFFLAEFVTRMATYGSSVDSIQDAMLVAANILLRIWDCESVEDIDKQVSNPFSFLSLFNSLIQEKEVKSNFLEVLRKATLNFKITEHKQGSEVEKHLSSENFVIVDIIRKYMVHNDKSSSRNNKLENVLGVFVKALGNSLNTTDSTEKSKK